MMSFKIYRAIQRIPLLIKLTVLSNGCFLLFLFRDIILYFCSFFLVILVLFMPIAGGIFVITLIWSMVYAIRHFKQYGIRAILPCLSHLFMLLLAFQVNFTAIWLNVNFAIFLPSREAVVALVQSGQLQANSYGQIHLPFPYFWTSCDGTINVQGKPKTREIMFYTFRGIDTSAGYVYSENQLKPNYFYTEMILGFQKYNHSWYWISST